MSNLTYKHSTLWEQFPGGPKSGGPGFIFGVEKAYEGDSGTLYLRDLGRSDTGSLLADTSARRLAEAILGRLAGECVRCQAPLAPESGSRLCVDCYHDPECKSA